MKKTIVEKVQKTESYIEGEDFFYSLPENPFDINPKLDDEAYYGGPPSLRWRAWPLTEGVERRVGNWVLAVEGNGRRGSQRYDKIRKYDEKQWYNFSIYNLTINERKYPLFPGEDLALFASKKYNIPYWRLNEPLYLDTFQNFLKEIGHVEKLQNEKEILKKVFRKEEIPSYDYTFGIRKNSVNLKQALIDIEWYRKTILKTHRRINLEKRKKQAEKKGISLKELTRLKNQKKAQEKSIKRTQQWVEVSNDLHTSLNFLQEVIDRMADDKKITKKWFDKGRRDLRDLASTLRPLRVHFDNK